MVQFFICTVVNFHEKKVSLNTNKHCEFMGAAQILIGLSWVKM